MAGGKSGICRFGAARLQPRIRAFLQEIDGVRAAEDMECVHRMRVASRRLRSALPLFASCFLKGKFRRWMRELKGITRALGSARDTDVQLAFLDQYERDTGPVPKNRAGIARIRAILEEDRRQEQARILAALDALTDAEVFWQLVPAVKELRRGSHGTAGADVYRLAATRAGEALDTLLSYDAAVRDPGNVQGHHAMRIAAKKLRYTLEVFRPLYPDRLRPAIRSIKRLQELLGQLHDCDVWIALLSGALSGRGDGTGRPESGETAVTISRGARAGITALLTDRRAARQGLYGQLVTEWERYVSGSFPEQLRAATGALPAQKPESLPRGERLGALGGLHPEGAGHARQVTRLALQLFDALVPLHGYGKKERNLLEYAGLLHDIGWVHGQQGHHTRSCRMILADRTLPVKKRERTIIALLARHHRKELPDLLDRVFAGLKQKDRQRVLALAALLRIADGLDYTHANRVVSLSCTIDLDAVTCVPVYDGDGGIERARALQKADLFARVYDKRFAIP